MRAVVLNGYEGAKSLRIVDVDKPQPAPSEILIQVKAAGINFAELELIEGRYQVPKEVPFIMGFEAAGIVIEAGHKVKTLKPGDRVTSIVSSGGYAEYTIADASAAIPIPDGLSFAEASTIPIQGLSAYALLKYAAKLQPGESILIQSAAGGVGLYLTQLAKLMGSPCVVGLGSTNEKEQLLKRLGADVAVNYSNEGWADQVREATGGKGIEVVLEQASGEVSDECFKLIAPFGRVVMFGAKNVHDTLPPEKVRQLIFQNQSITGFNFPSLQPSQIAGCVRPLLELIRSAQVKLFAQHSFALADVGKAYEAMSSRRTMGKIVLIP
jgi:NADPH2:quinone reductase